MGTSWQLDKRRVWVATPLKSSAKSMVILKSANERERDEEKEGEREEEETENNYLPLSAAAEGERIHTLTHARTRIHRGKTESNAR